MVDWNAIRQNYPGTAASVFLNSGSRGLLSRAAVESGTRQLHADMMMTDTVPDVPVLLAELRSAFAGLIGAEGADIAIVRNVSEGLNAIGHAIDWKAGDEIVVCRDLEHANNVHLWETLAQRGVRLIDVPAVNGAIDADAFAAAISPRTRLVTVSAVTMAPGFRAPLAAISATTHKVGAFFLVDAVQATGLMAMDVVRDGIDALVTSTSKGLLGPRGLGLLYVNRARIRELTPVYVARNSFDPGGKHYSETGGGFQLHGDARRFECGHYNVPGAVVALTALKEINALGIGTIEARVTALAQRLAHGFAERGWPVAQPPEGIVPSHIVTVGHLHQASGTTSAGDQRLDALSDALARAGVKFAIRRGMLRFGFHFYNNEADADIVLRTADALERRAA